MRLCQKICAQKIKKNTEIVFQNADCIAVVGEKEILEMGTHQQLMEKGGAYASLYQV